MDIRLTQQQTQKLILSPQIQQYLKLLQLPIAELSQNVEQELMENPVLEIDSDAANDLQTPAEEAAKSETSTEDDDELEFKEQFDILEKLDENFKESYTSVDTKHESLEDLEKKHEFKASLITKATTIADYLNAQVSLLESSDNDRKIIDEMIGNVSEDGYFRTDLNEIAELFQTPLSYIENILITLQSLDPAGIFGRNLQEVLLLQIERKPATTINKLAFKLLDECFNLFEKRQYDAIAKQLETSLEKVQRAIRIISMLEPKPGRIFYQDENLNVIPDVTIYPPEETGGEYIIEIHHEAIPTLRISQYYRNLIKDKNTDAKTREYIKQKINAGFWFMKALDQRKSTIRLITEEIVKAQQEFFEKGFAHLKPLTLRDIAEKINIHESTVSRALSGKFVSTSQGTISYKSFFSNKLETDDGMDESQKSVMEKIRVIIDDEDPKKPLSDSKIVELMKNQGIKIARRTVAKYRELMKILPSHLRKVK